ncbi:MAG: LytTR family DNA-binding domain-containing protein [Bacteroidia bacterium]|nr:LytTR family DNA-binding domain-containing protein [Bacteroidia bacterium]
MNIFLPTNLSRLLTMLVVCIVYALFQAFAFSWLVPFSYFTLFLDAFLDAIFIVVLSVFLNKAILFGNYVTLGIFQRFINYLALGLLTVSVWIGLSLLSSYLILDKKNVAELWLMIPMKLFIGILLYILIVQFIHNRIENDEVEEDADAEPINESNAEEAVEILDRVVVKIGQKIHMINVPDILYIQSDGDYVQIFTQENHFLKEETMKYFEICLPSATFVRIHRSYIVNIEKILRIELYEKRNQMLTLANGHKIKASASGYKLLREALNL